MSTLLAIPFISQREQPAYKENGCGAATLQMMLEFHGLKENIPYAAFCKKLNIDALPAGKGYPECSSGGVYPEDLHRYLVKRGIAYRVQFYSEEWRNSIKRGPIGVLMGKETLLGYEEGHWVLMVGADTEKLTLLDPWRFSNEAESSVELSYRDFYSMWTGVAYQILRKK